jgi:hypothetical protein
MNLWWAFWRLDTSRRALALEAGALLVLVRIGLCLISYTRLHRALGLLASRTSVRAPASPTGHTDVAWAVTAAGRRLPLDYLPRRSADRRCCGDASTSSRFGVRLGEHQPCLTPMRGSVRGDLVISVLGDLSDYRLWRALGS